MADKTNRGMIPSDKNTHAAGARHRLGVGILAAGSLILIAVFVAQVLYAFEIISVGFSNWRPVLLAFVLWGICLGVSQALIRGEAGQRALFILPALLFTIAIVIFPTILALFTAFTDWNLSGASGPRFNGLDNLVQLVSDPHFWNAMANMAFYVATVLVQYVIAFGLALLLNADIRARKFFRVIFLLPFMLSPVAVSWMIGKSLMDYRTGPISHFMRNLGWSDPSFFTSPWSARITVAALDAWVWIPFSVILLLAGLQAIPRELKEASTIDGAGGWQTFRHITFPMMLPVSLTTIAIRVIFQLKLADIVLNTTYGGPGGATDTVSSLIFRNYSDRSNVGYATMMAMVYLILIIIFVTMLLKIVGRYIRRTE